ncbi:MAG: PAS domain-containing protein [Sedimentisphaerales bacterium]|nr:PAS domain-containing protein [Sedimentisphaerales bacterium]
MYKLTVVAVLFAVGCSLTFYFHGVLGKETVFTHFFYIPIVLACLWWKRKGLIVAILSSASLVLSHILLRGSLAVSENYVRAVMFVAFGFVVTVLREQHAKTEEVLRVKDNAIKSSIYGIVFCDLNGHLIFVNDSFLKMWGYRDDKEVLGTALINLWTEADKEPEVEKASRGKGSWVGELVAKKKDGSTFDVQLSSSLVRDRAQNPICTMMCFIGCYRV